MSNINNGEWHDITATRDAINHLLSIEVDGQITSIKDISNSDLTNSVTYNSIGKRYVCGTTDNFIGNIDELKIYSSNFQSNNSMNITSINNIMLNSNQNSFSLFEYGTIILIIFLLVSSLGFYMNKKKKNTPVESTIPFSTSLQNSGTSNNMNYSQRQRMNICPGCSELIYPGEVFCAKCGKRL